MKPRGMLMIEHRLIEKMIGIMSQSIAVLRGRKQVDPALIYTMVDFIRTYADRTHHGKEEDILFTVLAEKPLSSDDSGMMQVLVDDHKYARETVTQLVEATERYLSGEEGAFEMVLARLTDLVNFYPEHIRKEDEEFFPKADEYLSGEELQTLLRDFREFDMQMIHEKYRAVVENLKI